MALLHFLTIASGEFQTARWVFMESGHGKGAPDGVGAAIKRAADACVRYGSSNVLTADDIIACASDNILTEKVSYCASITA
jgi:hypothetical protein